MCKPDKKVNTNPKEFKTSAMVTVCRNGNSGVVLRLESNCNANAIEFDFFVCDVKKDSLKVSGIYKAFSEGKVDLKFEILKFKIVGRKCLRAFVCSA